MEDSEIGKSGVPASGQSGTPGVDPPPGYGPIPGYAGYPPPRPTNNMALASFIVALVSLFTCPLIGAVAIYLGNRARGEIRTSGEQGDGLAQAGVIIGWCAVALSVVIVLFFVAYFAFFVMLFSSGAVTSY